MYPFNTLATTIEATSATLISRSQRPMFTGDFFRWLGIRLTMTLEPRRGPLDVYWNEEVVEGSVTSPASYGARFQMGWHRFENIFNALSFQYPQASSDPWYPVRNIIDGFNERRKDVITPGEFLCVHKSMSVWKGCERNYAHDGLSMRTKIIRKPDTELKSITDAHTGILLGVELMEGSERQKQKKYHTHFGESTAVLLRLVEPYVSSERTVVADSAFSSVKLLELLHIRGLYFMGMVKRASKRYPKKSLEDWYKKGQPRGTFKTLQSNTNDGSPMYAMCWADRTSKTIISNRGTTLPGSDSVRLRSKVVVNSHGEYETRKYKRAIPRPHMIEIFFSAFSTINVHDHLRQGSLEIENEWLTKKWELRVFDRIFGMVLTDAYLAYRYEKVVGIPGSKVLSFNEFLERIAYQLIFNDFVMESSTRNVLNQEDEDYQCVNVRTFLCNEYPITD
jgi:hypothetical protein